MSNALPPPQSASRWLRHVLAAVTGAALLILGFFFAVIALAIAGVVVAGLLIRWWWLTRRLRASGARTARNEVVEGEFVVVDEKERAPRER